MGVSLSTTVPNPLADGVYPYAIPVQGGLPPAEQTNLIGLVGTGDFGPVNSAVFLNTLGQAMFYYGANADLISPAVTGQNCSLVGAVQVAQPEGSNFACIRVSDGTDTAANGAIVDASAAAIANLAAAYTGTDGNTITVTVNLLSGSYTASGGIPIVQLVVAIVGRTPWTSLPFAAGNNSSGYVAATFLAGLKAALNGSTGASACPYVIFVSNGSSALKPAAAANTFSNGTSGIAFASGQASLETALIGQPGVGLNNTGMYALAGTGVNLFTLVNMTDLTQASTMAAFAQNNTSMAVIGCPSGSTTTQAIAAKQTDNASSPWLIVCNDWTIVNDDVDGTGPQYNSPAQKIAAGISQLQPYQDPSNKPYIGFQNFLGTTRNGVPYSNAELGQLQQAGVLIITNPISRGKVWGMAHGMASDGITPISDTRMLNDIANQLTAILGNFVGESQGPIPPVGTPDSDATRQAARDAVSAFMNNLANPNAPQIANWQQIMDATNNSNATIAAGYLYDKILVTTLAGIRFILLGLSVGETVQVTSAN